jgi:hypothetical protein
MSALSGTVVRRSNGRGKTSKPTATSSEVNRSGQVLAARWRLCVTPSALRLFAALFRDASQKNAFELRKRRL